jgi:transglutaminase-like putative cysteine protease
MIRAFRTAVIMLLVVALSAAVFAYSADGSAFAYASGDNASAYTSGDSTLALAEDENVYYDTREEAAAALRKAMKNRKHLVTVAIYEKVDEKSIKTIIGEVFQMAIEHTGKPKEGDYLKYQFADYKGKAETDLHWGSPVVIIRYVINYYTDKSQETETNKKVKEIKEELDLEGKSDYNKIKAIHDYLCDNIEYDVEKSGDDVGGTEHTAYGALVKGKAVCQGYALSMYRLLLESGVDCRIVDGQGIEEGGMAGAHSWNIVGIGGVYFYVDTTWDDSMGTYDYFLCNRDDFEKNHVLSKDYSEDFVTKEYPVTQSGFAADYDTPIKALNAAAKATIEAIKNMDAA